MNIDKIKNCLKEGERGERHKGLRKRVASIGIAGEHMKKARHNFDAINDFYKIGYSDWSASAAFYSLYHLLLAILAKRGFESRNQSCTFALIEDMIDSGDLDITKEELKEIFDKDVTENLEHSNKILDFRETMQYSYKTFLEKGEFEILNQRTKVLFNKLMMEAEKNNGKFT